MLDTEKHIQELMDSGEFKEDDGKGVDVPFFKLESILAATDNFSDVNKLGQGGYGPVYKGKFPGGQEIAIKRLSSDSGQGLQEFKNEVVLIAKLQHRNLVWRLWTENKVLDLMDHNFQESCKEDQFIKCVTIGLLCVQEDPSDRPNMSNIITMLDNDYVNLPSPKQPAFVLRRGSSSIASSSSKPETNIEITYTVEDGR
ncbi:Tyrosine-protein kinase [Parasponia andersonii]|uniref:Tyrosine-protein kinase n=1 Tax=Parasponia andersonii TaxID=3476 RepID=A0A2P5E4M1_PARAD|nr:Tyrosine-protein kinase [Parasponia andersonii]